GEATDVQAERGRGFIRLARLYASTGHNDQAEQAFRQGIDICRQIGEADPGAAVSRGDEADGLIALGNFFHILTRLERAEAVLIEARKVTQSFVEAHPSEARPRRLLGTVCHELGKLYRATRRLEPTEEALKQSLE